MRFPLLLPLVLPPLAVTGRAVRHGTPTTALRRRVEMETRIVGGEDVPPNAYPWHVEWALGCGGTLIHDDLVLTAGHCHLNDAVVDKWPLFVGGDGTTKSGTTLYAEAAHVHPLYDAEKVQAYDFMVLKLPETLPNQTKVELNTQRLYPVDRQTLTVMGFGLLHEDEPASKAPKILQQVQVNVIEECAPTYFSTQRINDDIVFCAGVMPEGGKDACQGDSGGPIIDQDGVQVGLVSWGVGCARARRPGVYARVSVATTWIEMLKCTVSSAPPQGCTQLDVQVTMGTNPEETGYMILDENNHGVIFQLPGSFTDLASGIPAIQSHQIPPGNYVFVFFGTGNIIITSGKKTLTLDGEIIDDIALLPNVGDDTLVEGWDKVDAGYAWTSRYQSDSGSRAATWENP